MYTVAEAREKWCPYLKVSTSISGNNRDIQINRPDEMRNGGLCIADECMAWRVAPQPSKKVVNSLCPECQGHGIKYYGNDDFPCGCITYEKLPDKGYCGLAGKP